MKFVNITTLHTSDSLDLIASELPEATINKLTKFYNTFNHIEYTLENGDVAMFAIIDTQTLVEITSEYIKCGVSFSTVDLTKEILFGYAPSINNLEKQSELNQLVKDFIEDNLNMDIVLDKIIDKGIESLTEYDKLILQSI